MKPTLLAAALAATLLPALSISPAEAAKRKPATAASAGRLECLTNEGGGGGARCEAAPRASAVAARAIPAKRIRTAARAPRENVSRETPRVIGRNSISLAGITPPLAAKAQEIVSTCGSKIVSSIRRGARVYGGSRSNHASGRAVDLQGNPACIYASLRGWPGGVSTDYSSAPGGKHVHVSYNPGGMEWGLRFRHRHYRRR
jgi:hypothetical protein